MSTQPNDNDEAESKENTDCPHHFQQDGAADLQRCIYCGTVRTEGDR